MQSQRKTCYDTSGKGYLYKKHQIDLQASTMQVDVEDASTPKCNLQAEISFSENLNCSNLHFCHTIY